ncbi:MAG TPA: hypothetical protein VGP47_02465 [Parachlamydiaceae bacterium]|nr:hypothetical protein [Parachlamydiaceae bacterium]
MSGITNQISKLFFPPILPETTEVTFKIAMDALNTQRIARITKAVIYTFASIATTVTLVLTEAAIIAWPMAIPSIVVSIISALVFYRLNSLDKRYVEMLDDKTRESVAKKELDRLLLSDEQLTSKEISKSLNDINRLLGLEIFAKADIDNILRIHTDAALKGSKTSLGAFAFELNQPIVISSTSVWFEQGYFNLPHYEKSVGVTWNGNPSDPISTSYKKTETDKNGNALPTAIPDTAEECPEEPVIV